MMVALNRKKLNCLLWAALMVIALISCSLTGLNIILHCKPEGKYESIAVADAVWCDESNPLLQRGGPDQEGFLPDMLDILPYECMDGINEKGLFVSVQRVDIKEGDQPSRFPAGSSMLLRHMLDDCANVDEAMPESTALTILQSVVQNPYTNASGISMTQYSAIYNNAEKTVEVWPFQNYSKSFVFDVEGNRY